MGTSRVDKEKGEEMKQLEKYYNERVKQKGDTGFKELSEDDKKSIEKCVGFNRWKLNQALKQCGEAIVESLKKTREILRQLNIFESTYHRTIDKK